MTRGIIGMIRTVGEIHEERRHRRASSGSAHTACTPCTGEMRQYSHVRGVHKCTNADLKPRALRLRAIAAVRPGHLLAHEDTCGSVRSWRRGTLPTVVHWRVLSSRSSRGDDTNAVHTTRRTRYARWSHARVSASSPTVELIRRLMS